MAKVKSDTSYYRVQFNTFRTEDRLIQQNVKTAEKLGGSNVFATLSQVLTYNSLFTASPLAGVLIYGFSWSEPREAASFFSVNE